MSGSAVPDSVLDGLIALLAAVLAYLILRRKNIFFRSRPVAVFNRKDSARTLRQKALRRVLELKSARLKNLDQVQQLRKKYMKGELSFDAYSDLDRRLSRQLVEIDAELSLLAVPLEADEKE